jgi:ATP-dependent DNA helicase RecG
MTKTELLEIIRNGENSGVEFKRDDIQPRDLAEGLVELANLEGGCILLGVENNSSISGLARTAQQAEEWVMNIARDKVRPEIIPYFEVIRDVEPGKDVAVVRVQQGYTVHHVWHNNHRTYYIRVGTQTREATQDELAQLFQQRGAFHLELRPLSGSSRADLDMRRLRDYFSRINRQEIPSGPQSSSPSSTQGIESLWLTLLVNTEFLSDESSSFPCTVAGLLLFGKSPNRFLPQAGIDAVAYQGTEKDYAAIERASLRGPMVGLFGTMDGGTDLLEPGLVEQAIQFVRRNAGVTATLAEGSRVDQPAYPEEALREAVVNALVHRDYLLSATKIELSLYADRLEIISPGHLPNGITPARMLVGRRAARNELLKDVMKDYRYMEHAGMGIPRKIVRCMLEHNGTSPDLIEDGERFILRLWKEKKP